MGLDIYLYSAAQEAANDAHNTASEAFYGRDDYEQLSQEQKDELRQAIPPYEHVTDAPSEKYPDHLFNRRYLRSSYNGGGFNRAVPDMIAGLTEGAIAELASEDDAVGSLYWIFQPMGRVWDGDEGQLTKVDLDGLRACEDRALRVADMLRNCDPLRVEAVHMPMFGAAEHMWQSPPSDDEVLSWYRRELKSHAGRPSDDDGGYGSAKGTVYGFKQGLDVLAITVGLDVLGRPAPMIVYRSQAVDSYIQSAEIVAEFCAEAIGLIEQDGSAYISWSG